MSCHFCDKRKPVNKQNHSIFDISQIKGFVYLFFNISTFFTVNE